MKKKWPPRKAAKLYTEGEQPLCIIKNRIPQSHRGLRDDYPQLLASSGAAMRPTGKWMAVNLAEFSLDTGHLDTEEIGMYFLLLAAYWHRGEALPDDDKFLARQCRMSAKRFRFRRQRVSQMFSVADGLWTHQTMENQILKSCERSAKASASAQRMHSVRIQNASLQVHSTDTVTVSTTSLTTSTEQADRVTASRSKYVFESGSIKLNRRDFENWQQSFSALDLRAELESLSGWEGAQGKNWFHATKAALAKRNREVREARIAAKEKPAPKYFRV